MVNVPRILAGRYEVGELIGRGGMAEVHAGRDTRINRDVAIKILREDLASDPLFQERFRREAQAAGSLNHPAIVAVYDNGEEPVVTYGGATLKLPYIVMEYVDGHTVRALLHEGDAVPIKEAVQITIGVLDALEYSHTRGIVHRDIKPGNIMLTNNGDTKVMDFGIARALADSHSTMTQTNSVVGTAQYLSPEQARGEQVDTRSDLYSTGCLLYELLTGRPPFKGDNATSVAVQHVQKLPTPPSKIAGDIPDLIDRIVMKSLAKDREKRYQDAASFREDLQAAMRGLTVVAPPVDSWLRQTHTRYATAPRPYTNVNQIGHNSGPSTVAMPSAPATTVVSSMPTGTGPTGINGTVTLPEVLGTNESMEQTRAQQAFNGGRGRPQSQSYQQSGYITSTQMAVRENKLADNHKSKAGTVIVTLFIIALLAISSVFTYLYFFKNDKDNLPTPAPSEQLVEVPQLNGLEETAVRSTLMNSGFNFLKAADKPSETIPKGQFVDSSPRPGEKVAKGTQIKVSFSSGPGTVKIPDLRNKTQEDARAILKQLGLQVGDVTTVNEPTVEKSKVVSTVPATNETVTPGSAVNLQIASGNTEVPNVIGKNREEATDALRKAGLTPEVVLIPDNDTPAGMVITQLPENGLVDTGSSVRLEISTGPDSNYIPNPAPSRR